MAEVSGISWTDSTFNPWIGCAKVSPACDGCYAAALMGMDGRHKRAEWGEPGKGAGTRVRTVASNWSKPRSWNRKAAASGKPHFVFCASLADVFDNEVPLEWRQDLFALIRETPHLTWLLLTKRPGMIERLWFKSDGSNPWPTNAAIGCTVVNQEEADRDIPKLLAAKAGILAHGGTAPAFTFLSMEPLLGPVDLTYPETLWPNGPPRCCSGADCGCLGMPTDPPLIWGIDWVITGGETTQGGHQARPQHADWFREIRDQCAAAGVPYHHKQNGEWDSQTFGAKSLPGSTSDWATIEGRVYKGDAVYSWPDGSNSVRVGKDRAGRLLDGVTHDARPTV